MPKITRDQVKVPVDVLVDAREAYIDNYMAATRGTGRLMLFACDQKVEHMNGDFYGEGIDIADLDPEHLFKIADQGVCGVMAGQRGLIGVGGLLEGGQVTPCGGLGVRAGGGELVHHACQHRPVGILPGIGAALRNARGRSHLHRKPH